MLYNHTYAEYPNEQTHPLKVDKWLSRTPEVGLRGEGITANGCSISLWNENTLDGFLAYAKKYRVA